MKKTERERKRKVEKKKREEEPSERKKEREMDVGQSLQSSPRSTHDFPLSLFLHASTDSDNIDKEKIVYSVAYSAG